MYSSHDKSLWEKIGVYASVEGPRAQSRPSRWGRQGRPYSPTGAPRRACEAGGPDPALRGHGFWWSCETRKEGRWTVGQDSTGRRCQFVLRRRAEGLWLGQQLRGAQGCSRPPLSSNQTRGARRGSSKATVGGFTQTSFIGLKTTEFMTL